MRPTLHDRLAFLTAAGLVAACLIALGLRVQVIADHSVDLGGAELNVLHGIQQVVKGRPVYTDPERAPFAVVQYTPAYLILTGSLCKAAGIDPDDARGMQQVNRAFSLLLNMLMTLGIVLAARAAGAGQWNSVSCGALGYLALSQHFFARVDSLYALFFVFALLFILRWAARAEEKSGKPEILMVGILTALALFTKQTAALLVIIIPVFMASLRAWRPLLRFSIAFLVAGIAFALILLHGERWDLFVKNTIGGLANGMSATYIQHFMSSWQGWCLLGWHFAALIIAVLWIREEAPQRRFLAIALPISLAFTWLALLKSGSDFNYFFETLVLTFIACGAWLGQGVHRVINSLLMVQCVLFAGSRLLALREWHSAFGNEERLAEQWSDEMALGNELAHGLRPEETVILTYRSPLEITLDDKVLVSQRDIIQWSRTPPFDLSRFDAMMRDDQVRYVVSDRPLESMTFITWVYPLELERKSGGRWLYRPVAR